MRCPHCGSSKSRVTNSRNVENGIRRRRECQDCNWRFTTYERIHAAALMVTKRDNRREEFDREKLAAGARKACAKRPVPVAAIEKMVEDIEGKFQGQGEVAANVIGEAVMDQLKNLDRVAYIRYASVYRDFQDIESFEQAVDDLREGRGAQLPLSPIEPGPNWRRRSSDARERRQRSRRPGPAGPELELTPESALESAPDSEPGADRNRTFAQEKTATETFGTNSASGAADRAANTETNTETDQESAEPES